MYILYQLVLFIHIATAIIGLGQTFLYPWMLKLPQNVAQVKTIRLLLNKSAPIAKYSDYILLFTGIILIIIGQLNLVQNSWLIIAFILFVLMRLSSSLLCKKTFSHLAETMDTITEEKDMAIYKKRLHDFLPNLWITQSINFALIIVMVLKPNIPFL